MKEEKITANGEVVELIPGCKFKVKLDETGSIIICTLSGKLRMYQIRILLGDHVEVDISPYDLTRGIIVWRK